MRAFNLQYYHSKSTTYPAPTDINSNTTLDYKEAGSSPGIITQPIDTEVCPGCDTTITVVASDADTYQWQFFNGSIWVDLTDSGIHSSTNFNALIIRRATASDDSDQYRAIISKNM